MGGEPPMTTNFIYEGKMELPESEPAPPVPQYGLDSAPGRIEDTLDALVIFEACRQGVLPKLHRRLCSAEKGETRDRPHELESPLLPATTSTSSSSSSRSSRHPTLAPKASSPPPSSTIHYQSQNLITPGSVFVFDEAEAKICRWTDGRTWSPSRICGNFLVYHELYRKLPKQKCSTAQAKANVRDGHGLKDKALREKVEQDGLVVLGSRKGTFVLKKDGLIKKTICVRGIRLPPLDQLQSAPSVASGASKTGGGGGGGRRGAKSAVSRATGVSFTGTQHLVCYEQAGAMEGLYRPRDYVELREIFLSKTFVTNQKLRDPVRVKPLPADQAPVEPTDEYIRQTRIVEVRTPPKPTLPPTEPAARSTPTSRKGSSPVSRLTGKRSSETKATNILNHPYTTRGQDRQLREVLEESQALETSGSKSRSAYRLHANVDQINEDYEDEATSDNGGSGETRVPSDPCDMKNTRLHLEPLAKDQICESNRQEDDEMMGYPTTKIFRNSKRRKNYSQVEEPDTSEPVLSQTRDQERPPRCVDNDATERSSSKMSSPGTVIDSMSLSSSLDLSPVTAPRDGPGALYRNSLSPTGSISYSENIDMEEAAQTLQRASAMAFFPPRQYSATANTASLPSYNEYFDDTPENSIRALLFEPDPVSPDYRYHPPPNNAQEWRYPGDHTYGPPPSAPLAYPEEHRYHSSSRALGDGDYHRWYPPYPPRPRGFFGDAHAIPGEYLTPFVPSYTMPIEEESLGSSDDYSSSDVVSSGSLERTPVHHEYQGDSPEGYIPYPNAWYQTMSQQVLQRQPQDRLQLHQVQEQQRIEYQKSMRYESSDGGSVGNPHSNAISSESMTSGAGEPKSTGTISKEEHTENVGSWTASVDFGEVKTEQKGIAEELAREQMSDSGHIGKSSSKRRRKSSGEYLTSINYEDLESPPTVENGARDRRELTSSHTVPTGFNPWTPSQPIQIMSHVHINPRRRPNVTIESSRPAEDDTSMNPNEYLLYSHHQPAILEVVQEDTVPAHDEPPSAHLGSEEDPFFSDLRAHGIGGRSCLAVHASSSPMEPSSAADEHDDEPRDGSAKNQF
ncbi:hypothetical protein BG006_004392 [Podila minutissima]|uniref:Uncharacterized protein n=1 Tax=Podila minutissima TaxID=64525 RepID=A0A9P5VME0_9FUNG|nr:hypothetical protein BG006_004392 [Podila minutissima]